MGSGLWGVGSREWGVGSGEREWWKSSHSPPLLTSHFPLQFLLQRSNLVVKHLSQTNAFLRDGIDLPWLPEFYPSGKNQVGFICKCHR